MTVFEHLIRLDILDVGGYAISYPVYPPPPWTTADRLVVELLDVPATPEQP